ncbi:enoyl-CoA hydratase/isomerase family protein [Spongiibacter taiwanensis]|uniref:enoyl-CoA hydratase/isomerase family protein n=1 Tax=Spongiibacter taiwanensis TaxID=1748242 RepID=UPI0020353D5E|nr:enoyl-CoA hydratase/isomerase family protein [Spongiibacter taiwanensis]USA42949.1 enoyl-CoA hydratase/isomerase family protein [Spongiibacter taiwanensis]
MGYHSFELTVTAGVARLVWNQPDTGNTMDESFCREFGLVANELTTIKDLRLVVITARGKYFSLGGDIKTFSKNLANLPNNILSSVTGLHIGISRLMRLDVPVIASVHGVAMGGAVAVLANCDLVLSGRSVKYGAAYHHVAFPCDLGATTGLASRMGVSRAKRFLMLGEVLDADQAFAAGLVDEVVEDDQLATVTEDYINKLANGPTVAFGMVRKLMASAFCQPFDAQLEDEAQALVRAAASEDAREGVEAFIQRRAPVFKGR